MMGSPIILASIPVVASRKLRWAKPWARPFPGSDQQGPHKPGVAPLGIAPTWRAIDAWVLQGKGVVEKAQCNSTGETHFDPIWLRQVLMKYGHRSGSLACPRLSMTEN